MSGQTDVRAQPEEVKRSSWRDYAIRFAFGGVVTALVGIVGKAFGPAVAGLFLAFPAILPASLTLVAQHSDDEQAGEDAQGAAIGSVGLAVFGVIVWTLAASTPGASVLVAASALWFGVSVGAWYVLNRVQGG